MNVGVRHYRANLSLVYISTHLDGFSITMDEPSSSRWTNVAVRLYLDLFWHTSRADIGQRDYTVVW
jgi:hypothetical protein